MGCRILCGKDGACFYDSVTDVVFGNLFIDLEEAESFDKYVGVDLRRLTKEEFSDKLSKFRKERENE